MPQKSLLTLLEDVQDAISFITAGARPTHRDPSSLDDPSEVRQLMALVAALLPYLRSESASGSAAGNAVDAPLTTERDRPSDPFLGERDRPADPFLGERRRPSKAFPEESDRPADSAHGESRNRPEERSPRSPRETLLVDGEEWVRARPYEAHGERVAARPVARAAAQPSRMPRPTSSQPTTNSQPTGDEREVLALLAEGLDARAIAERTSTSYATVLSRVQGLLEKLDMPAVRPADPEPARRRAFGEAESHENGAPRPVVAPSHENGAPRPVVAPSEEQLREDRSGASAPLTGREAEVLSFMAEGLDNRAIAEALVVSYPTVRSHVQNILAKLNAHSRIEAVARAHEYGLLLQN